MATLDSTRLGQLAQDYQSLGEALMQYKLDNASNLSSLEFQDLSGRINLIMHNSNILAAMATYTIAADISNQLAAISDAGNEITGALKTIRTVQTAIDIATAVVNLGTSIISLNVGGIISGASGLIAAIRNA